MYIVFFLINFVILSSSYFIVYKSFPRISFSEKLIAAFLLYFSQITLTVLFSGIVIKNLGFFPLIFINLSISAVEVLLSRTRIRGAIFDFGKQFYGFFSFLIKSKDIFLYIILLLLFGQVMVMLVKIYYLPPHVWDVFAYHLHPAVEWFQKNMITDFVDTPVIRLNRNPMGVKLFFLWIIRFLKDITWLELPQFMSGILSVLSSYTLMLKVNVKRINALKYAALIYFIPLVLIESRTGQDHLALLGITLMAAIYFLNVFYRNEHSQIIFLGLSFGLLLGIKISGLHIIIVFFLALLLSKGLNYSSILNFLKKNLLFLGVGLLLTIALGGYWYVRNISIIRAYWVNFSKLLGLKFILILFFLVAIALLLKFALKRIKIRPLSRNRTVITAGIIILVILVLFILIQNLGLIKTFVFGYNSPRSLLSGSDFYRQYPLLKNLKSRFLLNLLEFPFRIKDIGLYTGYTPDFLEQSGFGVQFFSFGLLAYLMMTFLIFRKKYRTGMIGYIYILAVVLLGTYFIYYYSSANYRLFMFFPVIGLIIWAFLCEKIKFHKYYLVIIDLLIIGMIIFNILVTNFEGNYRKEGWKNILTICNPVERTSIKFSPLLTGDDWFYIDNFLSPAEPVGYLAHIDSWISPYFDNRLLRRIYHLKSLKGFNLKIAAGEKYLLQFNPVFKTSLKKKGIHYIHINPVGDRHLRKFMKPIFISCKDVIRVTDNLYYYKW